MRIAILVVIGCLGALAGVPGSARGEIYTWTLTGTVTEGSDRGTTSANAGDSIFGIPGSLDGRSFVLTVTVDDALGADSTESFFPPGTATRRSSLAGDRPVLATLRINNVAQPIGSLLPITQASSIRRGYAATVGIAGRSLAEVDIREDGTTTGLTREVFVQLTNDSSSQPPFANSADWRTPFTRDLISSDACNQCRFEISRFDSAGRRTLATGRLAPTTFSSDPPPVNPPPPAAQVPLPLWALVLAGVTLLGIGAAKLRRAHSPTMSRRS